MLAWVQIVAAPDLPLDAVTRFVTGGLISLAIWWLDEEVSFPDERLHTYFHKPMTGRLAILKS